MLKISNLHASIGDKEILKGINLEVKAGEVHAIMDLMVPENRHYLLSLLETKITKCRKEKSFWTAKIYRI